LADAVRQVDDQAVAIRLQVEEVDDRLDGLAVLQLQRTHPGQEEQLLEEARALVRVPSQQEILQHAGVLEQLDVLERPRDPAPRDLVGRHRGDVLAAEDEAAPRRLVDAAEQIEDRRLAGTESRACEISTGRIATNSAPYTAPCRLPSPPTTTIRSSWMDRSTLKMSGARKPILCAKSAPARPMRAAE